MALSPSIPTSFVPKQPVSPGKKHYSSGATGIFITISIVIAGLAVAATGGVYLYSKYLTSVESSKAAELVAAQNNVNPATVEQFVRLRDRLSSAETLINEHVELSNFFTLLESITLQNVHFTKLSITVAADNSATIDMTGVAKDFNSLAAESTAFAGQQDIQSAIFSDITVNSDNTVGFTLDATLAPGLITETAPPTNAALLPATTTTTTVSSVPTEPSPTTSP